MTDLSRVRHVALDMDGTIYRGGTLFDFTQDFLALLRKLGIGYTFLTNNCSKGVRDYLLHLGKMGIEARSDQLFTSAHATFEYLREMHPMVKRVFILGTRSLAEEFSDAGFTVLPDDQEPELVVVGFDPHLPYERLCKAAWWIKTGKPYIATHPDRVCPTDLPLVIIDCGAICACLQSATGTAPLAVLGKPDRRMLTGIMTRHGLHEGELAMVGDRMYTDVAMAHRAQAVGVLVLTGESTAQDVQGAPEAPDLVVPSIKEFGELLLDARREASTVRL